MLGKLIGLLPLLLVSTAARLEAAPAKANAVPAKADAAPAKADVAPATASDIATPDKVETRIGTLKFYDGLPLQDSVPKIYDNLDFMRGVEVFLNTLPGASAIALRAGLRAAGVGNDAVAIFDDRMTSESTLLTADPDSISAWAWIELKDGPVVIEAPPQTLGTVEDLWFRPLIDTGNNGPDRGEGGKYLLLPPGYDGPLPKGYYSARSPTFGLLYNVRATIANGDAKSARESIRTKLKLYPLTKAENPPVTNFVNLSGKALNTVPAVGFKFYEQINQIVQEEPNHAQSHDVIGLLAAIGIVKGKSFAPDARMKKILTEAAAVGNATARTLLFAARDEDAFYYPDSQWKTPFIGGSHRFERDDARLFDARTMFHFLATGLTPALAAKKAGVGIQYVYAERDGRGNFMQGANGYKLRLPPKVPVASFWSITLYDPQTRSMLRSERPLPSLSSQGEAPVANADGSIDIYFAPKAPAGKEKNWIPTVRGKSWFVMLRLYGPTETWFDQTWRPGAIEPLN